MEQIKITDYEIVSIEKNFVIIKDHDLYGIMSLNSKTGIGSIIIKPKYTELKKTYGDLYIINENGKYGLMNDKGQVIITPQFKEIQEFSEFLKILDYKDKQGLIDETGKIIVQPTFDDIDTFYGFKNGLAITHLDGNKGVINKQGREVLKCLYDKIEIISNIILVKKGNMTAAYNSDGKEIVGLGKRSLYYTRGDYFDACYYKKHKATIINMNGEQTCSINLSHRGRYALIYIGNNNFFFSTGSKNKIINYKGKTIKRLQRNDIEKADYKDLKEYRFFFMDQVYDANDGEKLSNERYDKVYDFNSGYAIVIGDLGYGIIYKNGEEIIKPTYSLIEHISNNNYLLKDLKGYYLYRADERKISEKFINCTKININGDVFKVMANDKYYLLLSDQNRISNDYDDIYSRGEYYLVRNDDKYGLLSPSFQELIPCQYSEFEIIEENDYLILKHSNCYSLFTKNGTELFRYKPINYPHPVNDDKIIIDNYLVDIKDIDNYISQPKANPLKSLNPNINTINKIRNYHHKLMSDTTNSIKWELDYLDRLKNDLDNEQVDELIQEINEESNKINELLRNNSYKLLKLKKQLPKGKNYGNN